MSEEDSKWEHAGIVEVKGDRIRVPNQIFENEKILSVGSPVYFSYQTEVKILMVSNRELQDDEYETVDFNKLGGEHDNFRVTIPSQFFKDKSMKGDPKVSLSVPHGAEVRNGENRHFIYHEDMAIGDIRSCYLLNDEEFDKRFSDSDRWGGKLSEVPRFIS